MSARHFLSLMDCTPQELLGLVRRGIEPLDHLRQSGTGIFQMAPNQAVPPAGDGGREEGA